MQKVVDAYFKKFTLLAGVLFVITALILLVAFPIKVVPFIFAYLLSFTFAAGNFFVMRKTAIKDNSRFFKILGWSFALRFILVIAGIIVGLQTLNYHQIFFTVSFIFSYICHSVIEIIFLNKILEIDT